MTPVMNFFKRYPIVAITLVMLVIVLGLVALGQNNIAQWVASAYVLVIVAITTVDMAKDIMRGHWGLDILAVVAMCAAVAVGEYLAALIIVLMLSGGEALEDFAANRAKAELTALLDRAPQVAHRSRSHDASSSPNPANPANSPNSAEEVTEDIPVDQVQVGDILLIKPAEVVPVDGELIEAEAQFDESSLTGESLPITRRAGESVMSGALNGQRAVHIRATATAADSQYQRIIALVQEAEEQKAPTVRIADRFAVPFTVVSLGVAATAWWLSGDPVRFAEVLVLATPCPLLIAAPVAFMGGMSRAAKSGVIVKGGATLEGLAKAASVGFDKTGTLSYGQPTIVRIDTASNIAEDELLRLAASAEQYSSHVLAAGIIQAALERKLALSPGEDAEEIATNGVAAKVDGRQVVVGKLSFIQQTDPQAVSAALQPGQTAVSVAIDGRFAGNIVMADALRSNAAATVGALRDEGIKNVAMLTGDNEETAQALAAQATITQVHAHLLPQDKVHLVAELPKPAIMVGDGINDAPVLAAADVGIAMGARGSTAASESADVVIMRDDIGKVAQAVTIGKHTYTVALQAIWIGIILSMGLMLVASFGYIPAVAGALTQELVDLACILYALRALTGGTKHVVEL